MNIVDCSDNVYFPEHRSCVSENSDNGLRWTLWDSDDYPSFRRSQKSLYITWKFQWSDMERIDGYEGVISYSILSKEGDVIGVNDEIRVKVTKSRYMFDHMIDSLGRKEFYFEYCIEMKPISKTDQSSELEKNFEPSEMTDTVLVVDGKKMHVNKGVLSFHSAYFRTLFNSEFKEKSMEEIPIEDVKYFEFARLLSVISPNPTFANEDSCESLLELADRFMMPSVTRHVEHFLLTNSDFAIQPVKILPERILKLAERFTLPNVTRHVEQCLLKKSELRFSQVLELAEKYTLKNLYVEMFRWICTKEHMKNISESLEFHLMGDRTARFLFKRFVQLC